MVSVFPVKPSSRMTGHAMTHSHRKDGVLSVLCDWVVITTVWFAPSDGDPFSEYKLPLIVKFILPVRASGGNSSSKLSYPPPAIIVLVIHTRVLSESPAVVIIVIQLL